MLSNFRAVCWTLFVGTVIGGCVGGSGAVAAGVLYADPGWYHALEGNSAYYYDPDGPNPDYLRTSGPDDMNQPGGQSNYPALVNPGPCADVPACTAAAIWQVSGSQWEGSAPGDPLGGVPGTGPPLAPPAPGGVGAFADGATTFIRMQDAGQPQAWGWADKNDQGFTGGPRQEGSNRRIQFKHEMNRDAQFSDRQDILDFGVTITFRTRISTPATGPIDAIYPESGSGSMAWPADGIGYPIGNNGRSMFMVTQTGADGPGQLAFGLINTNTITANGLSITRTGLVMNNAAAAPTGNSPDTGDSTAATLNMLDIPDAQMQDWHEFWITVKKLAAPVNNSTHEVNVYLDGSLTPTKFNVILGNQNEFGNGSHLGMGLSSGSRFGAYDIDYFAYKEGVVAPTLQGLAGDYNNNGKVDGADYVVWRRNLGATFQLTNEVSGTTPGQVTPEDYVAWRARFGNSAGSGSTTSAVPEPSSAAGFVLALLWLRRGFKSRQRS